MTVAAVTTVTAGCESACGWCAGLLTPEDGDRADRAGPAQVVRESELRVLHLDAFGPALQLPGHLADHAAAGRADRMAERLEPTRRINGERPVRGGQSVAHEVRALALLAEAEVLVVEEL